MRNTTEYLNPGDPDSFRDIPLVSKEELENRYHGEFGEVCPKCLGHGKWNLKVNAYESDIPAHRHFQASCGSCWGWGYLEKGQTCAHEWGGRATEADIEKYRPLYRCEHAWKCSKCGQIRIVDSSD